MPMMGGGGGYTQPAMQPGMMVCTYNFSHGKNTNCKQNRDTPFQSST